MSETLSFDVVIVGAGPAGLTAAIRLKQLCQKTGKDLKVCVLEKGAEVGAHILSGNVFEHHALAELFPDWKERGAPLSTPVIDDSFIFLTERNFFRLPTPPQMKNHGNYVISLANFCRWLAAQAEALGVEIYPGFAVAQCLFNDKNEVIGVETNPVGLDKEGHPTEQYEPGVQIMSRHTLFGEGCRGSLTKQLSEKFGLQRYTQPQTYALGIKELWEISPEKHKPGTVTHTIGWPLDQKTYGGSFIYHMENNQVSYGLVIGLDYKNPYLNPYEETQRLKLHPYLKTLFEGGRRISYGARALNEGGWQSIPQLGFPGGSLIGCSAGFLNVLKIKGTHTAMKSAMIAAETIFEALSTNTQPQPGLYDQRIRQSWIRDELYPVRNIRPGFKAGFWLGMVNAGLETYVFRGQAPWTFSHHEDNSTLSFAAESQKIDYPKPDGKITFDRLSSVYLSNTNHKENQPCHLKLRNPETPISYNLKYFDAPEQRYCPAGVYEIIKDNMTHTYRLQINGQNCVHCKTCDIKDPLQNISWVPPEGGDGPRYPNM